MPDTNNLTRPNLIGRERRKFVRINANFIVSYYVYPYEINKKDLTLSRNISLGGICFTTDKFYNKGTILHITLKLPKIVKTVACLGQVVYVLREKSKNSLYDLGVKFIQVADENLYILEKIIKACASRQKKIYVSLTKKKD